MKNLISKKVRGFEFGHIPGRVRFTVHHFSCRGMLGEIVEELHAVNCHGVRFPNGSILPYPDELIEYHLVEDRPPIAEVNTNTDTLEPLGVIGVLDISGAQIPVVLNGWLLEFNKEWSDESGCFEHIFNPYAEVSEKQLNLLGELKPNYLRMIKQFVDLCERFNCAYVRIR